MKVIDILRSAEKPFASFELVPPLKGSDASRLYQSLDPLMEFQPPFINITCHRDEIEFVPNADGTFTRMTLAKRPGTVAIVAAIMRRYPELEIVPHVICGGSSCSRVESELLDLHFLGLNNIMALRGDLPKDGVVCNDYVHASDLIRDIRAQDPNICIGGACYPEGHIECTHKSDDIHFLKEKVDAGCDFLTTQMFFDNNIFYNFLYRVKDVGINVPIVPGIMPITTAKQLSRSVQLSGTSVPERFKAIVDHFGDDPVAMRQAGIIYATEQIIDLIANGITHVHVYSMNKPDVASDILYNLKGIIG